MNKYGITLSFEIETERQIVEETMRHLFPSSFCSCLRYYVVDQNPPKTGVIFQSLREFETKKEGYQFLENMLSDEYKNSNFINHTVS